MSKRVLFILSRGKAAKLGPRRTEQVVEALGGRDRVEVEVADTPAEVPTRIVQMSDRVDAVALGGGDGTMSTAASALMQTGLPLAVIPLGTANDLARSLNVPLNPVRAAALVATGRVEDIDVGEVNGHHFFNAAGVGLTVDVAERLATGRKIFGPMSYLKALADVTRARRSFRARVMVDEDDVTLRSIQVTVANGIRHGGGVIAHETASIDDGMFDLYSLEPQSLRRLLSLFPAFMRGTHHGWRSVTTMRGRDIRIETPGKPKRVNADGEIVSRTPARFRLHRNAVNVFLPE